MTAIRCRICAALSGRAGASVMAPQNGQRKTAIVNRFPPRPRGRWQSLDPDDTAVTERVLNTVLEDLRNKLELELLVVANGHPL
jgi:hypothetical protein